MKKLFIYSALFFFVGCTSINPPTTNTNTNTNTSTESTPVANFNYSPTTVREGQTITFTNTSTDYNNCVWDFGDNSETRYNQAGYRTIQVVIVGIGIPTSREKKSPDKLISGLFYTTGSCSNIKIESIPVSLLTSLLLA